jgi:hypothetical protein
MRTVPGVQERLAQLRDSEALPRRALDVRPFPGVMPFLVSQFAGFSQCRAGQRAFGCAFAPDTHLVDDLAIGVGAFADTGFDTDPLDGRT